MKICPKCKQELADHVKFCTHCGCELNEDIIDTYKDEKKRSFQGSWVLIIGIFVFSIVAVFCFFSKIQSPENIEPKIPEVVQAEQEQNEEAEEVVAEQEKDYEQIKRDIQFDLEHYVLFDDQYYYIFKEGGEGRILSVSLPGYERIKPFYNTGTEISFHYEIVGSQVQIIANQEVQLILEYTETGTFIPNEGNKEYFFLSMADFYSEWAEAAHTFEANANEEETYQYWDMLLNDVYGYLREHLSANGFKELKEKEIAWIRKKEAAMKDAETSSLKYETGAIWTEKRVYQLIEMIPF